MNDPLGPPVGTNQPEINSSDQFIWRKERDILFARIQQFCKSNNIVFIHRFSVTSIENFKNSVFLYICLFDQVPDYNFWKNVNQLYQQQGKLLIVLTDNILKFDDLSCIKFFSCPTLLGITASYSDFKIKATNPTKLYNCFIQRVDSVRQSWFYFLYQHNLLDQGYVSLLMYQKQNYSKLTGVELFDYIHSHYQLNTIPHFEQAYQDTRSLIPFRNFVETDSLLPYILDSKYSVALETYACEDSQTQWCFTEKSLRSLQLPTIPLLFVQRGGIGVLKSLGFKINNAIDQLDDLHWQQRQQHLLRILIDDSVDFDIETIYNQSQHNQDLLQSWKLEYSKPEFFDELFDKAI
jgi:hypothetical protein